MRIAVIGADGQLGTDVVAALNSHDLLPLAYPDFDIRSRSQVGQVIADYGPDWVINSAAMTHVDNCETDDAEAFAVNALGARYTAEAAEKAGAGLIYISTDYVFDGRTLSPYIESDPPAPLNIYGLSKLAGEYTSRAACRRHYIVRTCGLYGLNPCWGKGTNFVDKMLELAASRDRLQVVSDEVLTPTFTEDLASQLSAIIENPPPAGIYHATNSGGCSWFQFAAEIFSLAGVDIKLEETTAQAWNAPARRPAYSVLENKALKDNKLDVFPDWQDALRRYLEKRQEG
jgi:dTDP-4-dehydrorhamnose reductase